MPKPTALHKLHGTFNPTDHREREPIAEGELADAPAWMTEQQRETWRYFPRRRGDEPTLARTWSLPFVSRP